MNFYTGFFTIIFFVLSCVLTVCYSIRLVAIGFSGSYKFVSYLSKRRTLSFYFPVFLIFCVCCFSGSLLN